MNGRQLLMLFNARLSLALRYLHYWRSQSSRSLCDLEFSDSSFPSNAECHAEDLLVLASACQLKRMVDVPRQMPQSALVPRNGKFARGDRTMLYRIPDATPPLREIAASYRLQSL